MDDEITFSKNDTYRALENLIAQVETWGQESSRAEPKAVAAILYHLETAQLWSLKMVSEE